MLGIFDSGLGGLTVLKEITKVLPEYDYMYFGDTLHVPYGNRSDKAIYDLAKNACDYLFDHGCKLIIIACNTATAKALRKLQQEYLPFRSSRDIPRLPSIFPARLNILGVIRPVVEEIARLGKKRVGVIGTRGTVNSNAYVIELKGQRAPNQSLCSGTGQAKGPLRLDCRIEASKEQKENQKADLKFKNSPIEANEIQVFQQACPLLVPLIEEGWMNRKEMKSVLRYYLRPLKQAQAETLILGCTHYPLLLKQIRNIMGPKCFVPNPGEIVARSLKDYLVRHPETETQLSKNGTQQYFVTDLNDNFQRIASRFLDKKIELKEIT